MARSTQRVAVIGAGISGVATAAHLKKEGIEVTIFERSSAAGGVWYVLYLEIYYTNNSFLCRLYDSKKPLEPAYTPVPISQVGNAYAESATKGLENLKHAPPG
jgi:ACS family pantothenate transporter-like MFS transporter